MKILEDYRSRMLVDYIQYHNPRFVYSKIAQELDIPHTTTLRYAERLKSNPYIRFRTDFNIEDLDLKLVAIKLYNRMLTKHDIAKLPYRHWIAAAVNGSDNSSIIIYRIPLILDEKEIIQITQARLGASRDLEYYKILTSTMLAKPSYMYYFTYTPLNPVNAIDANDDHPIVSEFINVKRLLQTVNRTSLNIVRDKIDLFALAVAEINVLELEEKLEKYFKDIKKTKRIMKAINTHINHINSLMRGNRLIGLSRNNMKALVLGKASTGCLYTLLQRMVTYIYAYSIASNTSTGDYSISFDIPGESSRESIIYLNNIIDYINSICSGSVEDVIVYYSRDVIEYYSIPFQNYDFIRKSWIIDNRILEMQTKRWRSDGFVFYLL